MRNALALILSLLVCAIVPATVRADSVELCETLDLSSQQLIDACTSIIENPASDRASRLHAYTTRGGALLERRRYAEAVPDFDRALELNPDSYENLNNRAWAYFKWHQSTAGLDDVEKSIALSPSYYFAWDTRAHLRQLLGDFAGAFNDYETTVGIGGVTVIRLYQCGLHERGLYKGEINGIYGEDTRAALKTCAHSKTCDPLPANTDNMAEDINCEQTVS